MSQRYKNLTIAVSKFSEDLWIPYFDSLGTIDVAINGGFIDRQKLVAEFDEAMHHDRFDWIQLAQESELFISLTTYKNEELREYVENLLMLYLHPELKLNSLESEDFKQKIIHVLKGLRDDLDGWISVHELLRRIHNDSKYLHVRHFHVWDFFVKEILCEVVPIERQPLADKPQYIGYLRYKRA